jgi:hypothetical protein
MHRKHETINDPTLFYCFAIFCKLTDTFQFCVVPNKVVRNTWKRNINVFSGKRGTRAKRVRTPTYRYFASDSGRRSIQ